MRPALRLAMVMSVLVALFGAAFAGWRYWNGRIVTLRLAVTSLDSEDTRLAAALNRWMAQRGGRYRLRPVEVATARDGMDAVARGELDLAVARADEVWPAAVASALVLYKDKAVIVGLPRAGVTRLAQLQGRTIGVVGATDATPDPMLAAMLRLSGVQEAKFQPLAVADVEQAVARGQVQALARVAPFAGLALADPRVLRNLRAGAQGNPTVMGLADGEAAAAQDRRYETFDIPAGSLRAQPQLPPETVTTLSVARHLVLNRNRSSFRVARFVGEMIEAKRGIVATTPLAAQMDAPDDEASAVAPVHPGASAYFADETTSIWELGAEWGYLIFLLLGAIGSLAVWAAHRIWPESRAALSEIALGLLAVRREAEEGETPFSDLRARYEALMERLEEEIDPDSLSEPDVAAALATAALAERSLARQAAETA